MKNVGHFLWRPELARVLVSGTGFTVSGTSLFRNVPRIFVMRPFFRNAPIFHSAPTHYKKMSILSGVMHNKILQFFVVRRRITKNALQKYVVHSINDM